jgi:hypothetical protein
MTEEEYFRKYYPDFCYGDKPLSPSWDFFQEGVEFGERESEKQIEIDAKQIRALQKQNGERTDKVKELEAQIEKMKCCGNCKHFDFNELNYCHKGVYRERQYVCNKWEFGN